MVTITNAKYVRMVDEQAGIDRNAGVQCVYDGRNMTITINPRSKRYQEILRQVDAGTLTIADAD